LITGLSPTFSYEGSGLADITILFELEPKTGIFTPILA